LAQNQSAVIIFRSNFVIFDW